MTGSNPYYPEVIEGAKNTFFQNNRGQIKSGVSTNSPTEFYDCEYFTISEFLKENTTTQIDGGEEAYIDIKFNGVSEQDLNLLADADGDQVNWTNNSNVVQGDLIVSNNERYYYCDIEINSSTAYSPQTGELKIYISSPL